MNPRRWAATLRVSSRTQVKQATIETQDAELRTWFRKQGIDPDTDVYWFRDEGVSGDLPIWERDGAGEMREYIEAGLITEGVVAYHLDRVNRDDVLSYFELELLCTVYDLTLRTVIDNVDTSTEEGQLLGGLSALFSRKAKRDQLRRMHDGLLRRLREGRWAGSAPYGHSTDSDGRLLLNPATVEVIHEMVRLIRDERWSARAVADELEERGIPSPRDTRWYAGTVTFILRNPSLIGQAMYNRTASVRKQGQLLGRKARPTEEAIRVACPRILDDITFYEVQEILTDNAPVFRKADSVLYHFMLQRVVCHWCGARFYPRTNPAPDGGHQFSYRHRVFPSQPRCVGYGAMVAHRLEPIIWERVLDAMRDTERWRDEALKRAEDDQGVGKQHKLAQERVAEAKGALERLEDAHFIRRTLTAERYDALAPQLGERLRKAQLDVARLEKQLNDHQQRQQRVDAATTYMVEVLRRAESAGPELKQAICTKLIREVIIRRERGKGAPFHAEIVWLE